VTELSDGHEFFQDWLMPALEAEFRVLIHAAAESEQWFAKRCAENGLDRLLESQMWRDVAMGVLDDADVEFYVFDLDEEGDGDE
jgi:hypothetical protein